MLAKFIPLPRSFYEPTAAVVAVRLLGQLLVRKTARGWCGGVIVETEAYVQGDPAAHSFKGETARNRVMFGQPGHAYVYFIYGNHWCVNAVCQPKGTAEAVLIRAVEPTLGLKLMQARRLVANPHQLTNGPGKLCAALDIDRSLDGVDLCNAKSSLFIARNTNIKSCLQRTGPVITTTRIGITLAAEMPLRFYLDRSPFVSRRVRKA